MDDLRELGYDLEPIVGEEIRDTRKSELVDAILHALSDGGEEARGVLAIHYPELSPATSKEIDHSEHTPTWTEDDETTGKDFLEADADAPTTDDAPTPNYVGPRERSEGLADLLGDPGDLVERGPNRRHPNGYMVGPEDLDIIYWVKSDPINSTLRRGDLVPYPDLAQNPQSHAHAWLDVEGALAIIGRRDGRLNLLGSHITREHWTAIVEAHREEA